MDRPLLFAALAATALLTACVARAAAVTPAPDSDLIERLLRADEARFGAVLDNAAAHRLQILYTQIDRDEANRPHFTTHAFRAGAEYFYPASTVKLAGAVLALEKLNGIDGVTADTAMRIDSAAAGQVAVIDDLSSPTGRPSVGHYLHKLFLVSDNDAYNRLYEFVGQEPMNRGLWRRGLRDSRLTHRLSMALTAAQNRCTNPVTFVGDDDRVLHEQPLVCHDEVIAAPAPIPVGVAHFADGERVDEPMDFAGKNAMSLADLQGLLRRVIFPGAFPEEQRFDLTAADYDRLYRAMSMLPRESQHPRYADGERYYDGYVKFFLYGDRKTRIPDDVRLFNKVGFAYGFLTDNAYVVDRAAGVEYLLTATIYVNANGVLNDGDYESDEVGFPFLADLGRAVHAYEVERPRRRRPDLSRFAPFFPTAAAE